MKRIILAIAAAAGMGWVYGDKQVFLMESKAYDSGMVALRYEVRK
jgi:hypothetical protein